VEAQAAPVVVVAILAQLKVVLGVLVTAASLKAQEAAAAMVDQMLSEQQAQQPQQIQAQVVAVAITQTAAQVHLA
jgi:hypothetical protein